MPGSVFGGRAAWSTGEVNERIWFAFVARCRNDEDLETDFSSLFLGAVFVDVKRPALCFDLDARDLAVVQHNFGSILSDGARGLESKKQENGDEGKCFNH